MAQRPTAQRDRDRNTLRRGQPNCYLCGDPIDYTLPHLHPREFVADHVIPLTLGGDDDITNKKPSHRCCNAAKAGRLIAPIVRRSTSLR